MSVNQICRTLCISIDHKQRVFTGIDEEGASVRRIEGRYIGKVRSDGLIDIMKLKYIIKETVAAVQIYKSGQVSWVGPELAISA